jgi:iron complex transport system substrate-binding protein
MTAQINRRIFTLGASAMLAGGALSLPARAQETTSVTTKLGTYDIPLAPQRVVTIDHRTDLEPALVLGLPVIASGYWSDRPWVPVPEGMENLDMPTTAEHVLNLAPDLVICSADEPDDEWWPANRLMEIAPVLPTSFMTNWRVDLTALGELLGRTEPAATAIAEYDALIADIKTRHATTLAEKTIAAVQYFAEDQSFRVHLPDQSEYNNPKGELLKELSVKTVAAERLGEYGMVSYENLTAALEGVDGIYFADSGTGNLASLAQDPLWQRIPAVVAGRVEDVVGNTNFGSFYTARHVAQAMDRLLARLV